LYRSDTETGTQTLINDDLISDEYYLDTEVLSGQYYFYAVSAVDLDGNESPQGELISSRSITLDSGILLVDNTTAGTGTFGNPTEEDCDSFYQNIISDYDFDILDLEEETDLTTEELGIYSTVIWYMNSNSPSCTVLERTNEIAQYLDNGGQIIFSILKPSQLFSNANSYPAEYSEGDFLYDYLKLDTIEFNSLARFYYAEPMSVYEQINVDTTKTLQGLEYHIFNVEGTIPSDDGEVLYDYGSNYPTTNPFGIMNGFPVGIGYFGDDFKAVTFTFPFYYMIENEVEEVIHMILQDYFDEPVNIDQNLIPNKGDYLSQNYPNPFNPVTTISFSLTSEQLQNAELIIYNLKGQKVRTFTNQQIKQTPDQQLTWNGTDDSGKPVSSGLYFYRLNAGDFSESRKMLLLK